MAQRDDRKRFKKQKKQEIAERYSSVLRSTNASRKKGKKVEKKNRKNVQTLYASLDLSQQMKNHIIRDLKDYKFRSHNVDRQKMDLIKHLFVKYPVPSWMYCIFFPESRPRYNRNISYQQDFLMWFFAVAQGGSLRKLAKDVLTKKEVFDFVNDTGPQFKDYAWNVWKARCKCNGVNIGLTAILIERFLISKDILDMEYMEVIHFVANNQGELNARILMQLLDYLGVAYANGEFSLKGRTISSVIALSNEWHHQQTMLKHGKNAKWDGRGFETFVWKGKENLYKVEELTCTQEVYTEGKRQRHCVGSYAKACLDGRLSIFSMKKVERYHYGEGVDIETLPWKRAVTIELRANSVSQVAGFANRRRNNTENKVLNLWATKNGLKVSTSW